MIAGVINQTICTAHKHLFKEVSLLSYGVDCDRGLWKPFLKSYLLQTVYDSSCEGSYSIYCDYTSINKNLVTEKVCKSQSLFTDRVCSSITLTDLPLPSTICRK